MVRNRRVILAFSGVALLFSSVIYAWSVFVPYLQQQYGWSTGQTSGVFTLAVSSSCLGHFLGCAAVRQLGIRLTMRIGGLCLFFGFILPAVSGQLAVTYLGMGLLNGVGVGMLYNAILSVCLAWFPDRAGACGGILMMLYGVGSLVVSYCANFLMSHFSLSATYGLFAVLELGVIVFCSFFISEEKSVEKACATESVTTPSNSPSYTPCQLGGLPLFRCHFLWITMLSACGLAVIGSATSMGLALGMSTMAAVSLSGSLSLLNGVSRFFLGMLYDRFGLRFSMSFVTVLICSGVLMMMAAYLLRIVPALLIGAALVGLGYGGENSLSVAMTRTFYGAKYFSGNLAVLTLQMISASFIGSTMGGAIYGKTQSYFVLFVFLLLPCALSIFLFYAIGHIRYGKAIIADGETVGTEK